MPPPGRRTGRPAATPQQPQAAPREDTQQHAPRAAAQGGAPAQGAAPPRRPVQQAHPQPQEQAQGNAQPDSAAPRAGEVASATQVGAEQQLDEIRREGLTGRQLRMARRVAQKHGLAPTSDFDAVRLLRAKGIDPFQRATMLELVVPQNDGGGGGAAAAAPCPPPPAAATTACRRRCRRAATPCPRPNSAPPTAARKK